MLRVEGGLLRVACCMMSVDCQELSGAFWALSVERRKLGVEGWGLRVEG